MATRKINKKLYFVVDVCRELGDDLQRGGEHRGAALQPHLPPQGTVPHALHKCPLKGQGHEIRWA